MKRSRLRAISGPNDVESPAQDSDESLVALARLGDRAAFAELWQRHARSGLRVARQFTSSIEADDLVAEAYTRIYGRVLAGGGPVGAFRPYLYTTIRNLASRWGQASHEVQVEDIGDFEDPTVDDDPFTSNLDRTLTADAFRTLPERWQSVLWYTEVEGMDPHEVAPLLGISANGVAALSYRAREGLRKAWLQAHISDTTAMGECRWTLARLGDYTRNGLSTKDHRRVDDHLERCAKCSLLSQEVDEVGSQLAMVLLPLLFGATVGGTLLAAFSAPGSATAVGAASSASLVGTLALALVVSGGVAVGISHDATPAPQHSASQQSTAQPYSATDASSAAPVARWPGAQPADPGEADGLSRTIPTPTLPRIDTVAAGLGAALGDTVGDVVGGAAGAVGGVADAAGSLVHGVTSPLNTIIPPLPLHPAPVPETPVTGGIVGAVTPLVSHTLGITDKLLK